jgi:hypothetical protein
LTAWAELKAAHDAERKKEHLATYDQLRAIVVKFNKDTGNENGLEIDVDFDALWNLCGSYTDDLIRYTAYHDAPIPDKARRCAYLCKWIMKFRPLVVIDSNAPDGKEVRTYALMANEIFIQWCVSGILELDWASISDRMQELFLYTLRHRYNSEDTYILFFAQLCNH